MSTHDETRSPDLVGRDGKLRFVASRKDGKHSRVWSLWGNRNDFYLCPRDIGAFIKFSLHADGGFRVALVKEYWLLLKEQGLAPASRDLLVWPRPDLPTEGAVHVVSLSFPMSHLVNDAPKSTPSKPIVVFQGHGDVAAEIGLFFSQESPEKLEGRFEGIWMPTGYVRLDNGDSVSVLVRFSNFDPAVLPNQLPRPALRLFDEDEFKPGETHTGLHGILWNHPNKGEALQIMEVGGLSLTRND